MRAKAGWNPCVAWDAVQTVALSPRTSATAQDGPIEPWLCTGQ